MYPAEDQCLASFLGLLCGNLYGKELGYTSHPSMDFLLPASLKHSLNYIHSVSMDSSELYFSIHSFGRGVAYNACENSTVWTTVQSWNTQSAYVELCRVLERFCARVIDCFDMLLERTSVALKSETDCNFYAAAVNEANVIQCICISTHTMTGLMADSSELLFV